MSHAVIDALEVVEVEIRDHRDLIRSARRQHLIDQLECLLVIGHAGNRIERLQALRAALAVARKREQRAQLPDQQSRHGHEQDKEAGCQRPKPVEEGRERAVGREAQPCDDPAVAIEDGLQVAVRCGGIWFELEALDAAGSFEEPERLMLKARKFADHRPCLFQRCAQSLTLIRLALVVDLDGLEMDQQQERQAAGGDEQEQTFEEMPAQRPVRDFRDEFHSRKTHNSRSACAGAER